MKGNGSRLPLPFHDYRIKGKYDGNMTDSQIIALFWERNEDAIQETDAVYGCKLFTISDKILRSHQNSKKEKT